MKIDRVISFALEGADKVGKATQSNLLYNALFDLNVNAYLLEIPNKHHTCYDKIYDMLKRREDGNAPAHEHPEIFQTFIIANRFHVQDDLRRMAANQSKPLVIIFDRWEASSWAYGNSLNIPLEKIRVINDGLITADITFVLNGKGFARPEEGDDAFEDDNSFQNKVRHEYKVWAADREGAILINADRAKEIVHDEIFTLTKKKLIQEGIL